MANTNVTVEQVAALVLERADWPGRRRRVTASTLVEKFGVEHAAARDLLAAFWQPRLGVKLVLSKGQWSNAALVSE